MYVSRARNLTIWKGVETPAARRKPGLAYEPGVNHMPLGWSIFLMVEPAGAVVCPRDERKEPLVAAWASLAATRRPACCRFHTLRDLDATAYDAIVVCLVVAIPVIHGDMRYGLATFGPAAIACRSVQDVP